MSTTKDLARVESMIGQTVSVCPRIWEPTRLTREYGFPSGRPYPAKLVAIRYSAKRGPRALVEGGSAFGPSEVRLDEIRENIEARRTA